MSTCLKNLPLSSRLSIPSWPNNHSTEKWFLNETNGASFTYIKNILQTAKAKKLIKNFIMTNQASRITFNKMQERGGRIQNVIVSICEPYSQILTHIMVAGGISYREEDWKKIEDQECGKRRPRAHQVRFFNYVTKMYQYESNERLDKRRRMSNKRKNQAAQENQANLNQNMQNWKI